MRKSIIIKKKCAIEGKITEHYHYPETDKTTCAACIRAYRLNRYHSNINVKKADIAYNKNWKIEHPDRVLHYKFETKLKKKKIKVNFDNAKKDFIVMNLPKLQLIHNIYGLEMFAPTLINSITNINNTTVSKIMMGIIKVCRNQAIKKYGTIQINKMDLEALQVL